jgi:hypothetical protein
MLTRGRKRRLSTGQEPHASSTAAVGRNAPVRETPAVMCSDLPLQQRKKHGGGKNFPFPKEPKTRKKSKKTKAAVRSKSGPSKSSGKENIKQIKRPGSGP